MGAQRFLRMMEIESALASMRNDERELRALRIGLENFNGGDEVKLEDLVGDRILDAVDFSNEQVKTYGDKFKVCQCVRFRLDGKVYTAMEDPEDGYRSCMSYLTVGEWKMTNIFPAVSVLVRIRWIDDHGNEDEIVEIISIETGKTILEVGTANTGCYYPAFVASYHPEAIGLVTN